MVSVIEQTGPVGGVERRVTGRVPVAIEAVEDDGGVVVVVGDQGVFGGVGVKPGAVVGLLVDDPLSKRCASARYCGREDQAGFGQKGGHERRNVHDRPAYGGVAHVGQTQHGGIVLEHVGLGEKELGDLGQSRQEARVCGLASGFGEREADPAGTTRFGKFRGATKPGSCQG